MITNDRDFALFDADLKVATNGTYVPQISEDYPLILSFGPSFFESYQTWPNAKFVHGLNLAKNGSSDLNSLIDSIPYACKALSDNNFLFWEMGNEPDLYKTSAQGIRRPASWNETDYVKEWNQKISDVNNALKKSCGHDWVLGNQFKWLAPSFAGTNNSLKAVKTWGTPQDPHHYIGRFSSHNYIGGATQPGVTLAGTLMNHTKTVSSVTAHVNEHDALKAAGLTVDYILGETNSLYNQGAPGLSNSFGAALWGVDFALYCASVNIKQVFYHMGTDYRYASWQPIPTNKTSIGTKPPYYGNVAVAAALGNITRSAVRVQNIPMNNEETEAAYSVYAGEKLQRLMVVNMNQYNYSVTNPTTRPEVLYNFTVPTSCAGVGLVQRLIANGSDAITGITFNGRSYNYELNEGRPKLLGNVTKDEVVYVGQDGGVSVPVPWSSGALLQLKC